MNRRPDPPEQRIAASEKWIASIVRSLRRTVENGGYGTLEVEIFGGHIKRAVMKRSVIRPEDLEPEALAVEAEAGIGSG